MPAKKVRLINALGHPYRPAMLVENDKTGWYIEFWVHNQTTDQLQRKRLFRIEGNNRAQRRADATRQIREINRLLLKGYGMKSQEPKEPPPASVPKPEILTTRKAWERAVEIKKMETGKRNNANYNSSSNVFYIWLKESERENKPISELESTDIYAFLDWLKEVRGVGNQTRNNYLVYVRACLNALVKRKIIQDNPSEGISDLLTTGTRNIPFTTEEMEKLNNHLKHNQPDLYNFTRFIYYGFMRPIELVRLKVKHIDLKNRIILTRAGMTKNRKQMPVVITSQLLPVIESMKLDQYPGEWYVFSRDLLPGDKQIWRNRVSELHTEVLRELEMYNGELTMYSWKHTGNCNAYRAGVDIKSLQMQNRHHNLEMTEKYLSSLGLRISKELKNLEW